jgi:hypothetical protein
MWLRKQREEELTAMVGPTLPNLPPCTTTHHVFSPGWGTCRCGRAARDGDTITFQIPWSPVPAEVAAEDVAHIEPTGMTDDEVRRREHPEEYRK